METFDRVPHYNTYTTNESEGIYSLACGRSIVGTIGREKVCNNNVMVNIMVRYVDGYHHHN